MCTFAQRSPRRKGPVARCIGRRRTQQRRPVEYINRAARFRRTAQRRRRVVRRSTTGQRAYDRAGIVSNADNDRRRRRRHIARHRHRCRRTRVARRIACRYADLRAERQRRRGRVRPCTARVGCDRCIRRAVAIRIDLNRRARFRRARQRRPIRRIHRRRRRCGRIDRQIERRTRHAHVPRRIRCRDSQAMRAFTEARRRCKTPAP